jgi:DNA-binding NarL/FixJ family response regulator
MPAPKPRIFIVDDHALFREGVKLLIEQENLGEIMGEAENGQEFLDAIQDPVPDLVLMDIQMPVMDGLEATREALHRWPGLKILVLSMFADKENYTAMIGAGVMGFVLKTAGKKEFENAIMAVAQGENYFSNELLRNIVLNMEKDNFLHFSSQTNKPQFTNRELQVLKGFCNGLTPTEIAAELFLNVKTIEAHRSKLLHKTKSKNTINLVLFAIKNKIVYI